MNSNPYMTLYEISAEYKVSVSYARRMAANHDLDGAYQVSFAPNRSIWLVPRQTVERVFKLREESAEIDPFTKKR